MLWDGNRWVVLNWKYHLPVVYSLIHWLQVPSNLMTSTPTFPYGDLKIPSCAQNEAQISFGPEAVPTENPLPALRCDVQESWGQWWNDGWNDGNTGCTAIKYVFIYIYHNMFSKVLPKSTTFIQSLCLTALSSKAIPELYFGIIWPFS